MTDSFTHILMMHCPPHQHCVHICVEVFTACITAKHQRCQTITPLPFSQSAFLLCDVTRPFLLKLSLQSSKFDRWLQVTHDMPSRPALYANLSKWPKSRCAHFSDPAMACDLGKKHLFCRPNVNVFYTLK